MTHAEPISSLRNPRVKAAARLRDRGARKEQGRFLIDGARELMRAIEAGVELAEVFVCPALCKSELSREARSRLSATGAALVEVSPVVFAKLAYGKRAEGVLGVARTPRSALADLTLPEDALVAVLEGVEKPGNVGAVMRSADAAGASAVILADGGVDLYNPNTIRASLGVIFSLPVREAASPDVLAWLAARNTRIFTARVDAEREYTEVDFSGPAAIVLGSEAEGLSPQWSGGEVTPVRLPMRGAADSLNISAAAAVLFYEALRQRGVKG